MYNVLNERLIPVCFAVLVDDVFQPQMYLYQKMQSSTWTTTTTTTNLVFAHQNKTMLMTPFKSNKSPRVKSNIMRLIII